MNADELLLEAALARYQRDYTKASVSLQQSAALSALQRDQQNTKGGNSSAQPRGTGTANDLLSGSVGSSGGGSGAPTVPAINIVGASDSGKQNKLWESTSTTSSQNNSTTGKKQSAAQRAAAADIQWLNRAADEAEYHAMVVQEQAALGTMPSPTRSLVARAPSSPSKKKVHENEESGIVAQPTVSPVAAPVTPSPRSPQSQGSDTGVGSGTATVVPPANMVPAGGGGDSWRSSSLRSAASPIPSEGGGGGSARRISPTGSRNVTWFDDPKRKQQQQQHLQTTTAQNMPGTSSQSSLRSYASGEFTGSLEVPQQHQQQQLHPAGSNNSLASATPSPNHAASNNRYAPNNNTVQLTPNTADFQDFGVRIEVSKEFDSSRRSSFGIPDKETVAKIEETGREETSDAAAAGDAASRNPVKASRPTSSTKSGDNDGDSSMSLSSTSSSSSSSFFASDDGEGNEVVHDDDGDAKAVAALNDSQGSSFFGEEDPEGAGGRRGDGGGRSNDTTMPPTTLLISPPSVIDTATSSSGPRRSSQEPVVSSSHYGRGGAAHDTNSSRGSTESHISGFPQQSSHLACSGATEIYSSINRGGDGTASSTACASIDVRGSDDLQQQQQLLLAGSQNSTDVVTTGPMKQPPQQMSSVPAATAIPPGMEATLTPNLGYKPPPPTQQPSAPPQQQSVGSGAHPFGTATPAAHPFNTTPRGGPSSDASPLVPTLKSPNPIASGGSHSPGLVVAAGPQPPPLPQRPTGPPTVVANVPQPPPLPQKPSGQPVVVANVPQPPPLPQRPTGPPVVVANVPQPPPLPQRPNSSGGASGVAAAADAVPIKPGPIPPPTAAVVAKPPLKPPLEVDIPHVEESQSVGDADAVESSPRPPKKQNGTQVWKESSADLNVGEHNRKDDNDAPHPLARQESSHTYSMDAHYACPCGASFTQALEYLTHNLGCPQSEKPPPPKRAGGNQGVVPPVVKQAPPPKQPAAVTMSHPYSMDAHYACPCGATFTQALEYLNHNLSCKQSEKPFPQRTTTSEASPSSQKSTSLPQLAATSAATVPAQTNAKTPSPSTHAPTPVLQLPPATSVPAPSAPPAPAPAPKQQQTVSQQPPHTYSMDAHYACPCGAHFDQALGYLHHNLGCPRSEQSPSAKSRLPPSPSSSQAKPQQQNVAEVPTVQPLPTPTNVAVNRANAEMPPTKTTTATCCSQTDISWEDIVNSSRQSVATSDATSVSISNAAVSPLPQQRLPPPRGEPSHTSHVVTTAPSSIGPAYVSPLRQRLAEASGFANSNGGTEEEDHYNPSSFSVKKSELLREELRTRLLLEDMWKVAADRLYEANLGEPLKAFRAQRRKYMSEQERKHSKRKEQFHQGLQWLKRHRQTVVVSSNSLSSSPQSKKYSTTTNTNDTATLRDTSSIMRGDPYDNSAVAANTTTTTCYSWSPHRRR